MAREATSSSTVEPESPSSSSGNNGAADFECNICLDLAQEPVITLCGHLYCWPCLFRWLRLHSQSQDCPVCKALIQEEKLIPLYGRGKTPTDPRTRPIPELEIPNRPTGQRPETATRATGPVNFSNYSFGFLGGFFSFATANFGNPGGVPHPAAPMQFHGFPNLAAHGMAANLGGYGDELNENPSRLRRETTQGRADYIMSKVLLLVGFMVLYYCMY